MFRVKYKISKLIAVLFIGALLSACGGSSDPLETTPPADNTPPPAVNPPPPGGTTPPPVPVTKDINLSWTAPNTRTDGSSASLSDIGGYNLYVGTEPGTYNPVINVGNTTSHTLNSMGVGTYYIALSVYDTNALESSKSSEFSVIVN